jgi:HD-GYP domain-containing protein (c-di-GMP phosphodiesterase class II)
LGIGADSLAGTAEIAMAAAASPVAERVRAAEVIASLSLATDYRTGLPLEHGLRSTLAAMRLCERLGVEDEVASQAYFACLLFYVGCTADAEVAAELFDGELYEHVTPVMFGSRPQLARALLRAVAPPGMPASARVLTVARRLPRVVRMHPRHLAALCEVGQMLARRLGLPESVRLLFAQFTERWDGKGLPRGAHGDEIPLAARIVHVARDGCFQAMLAGNAAAAAVIRERSGAAFDPDVAAAFAEDVDEVLVLDPGASAWDSVLDLEPQPRLQLNAAEVDAATSAIGDFADLVSPYLVGHSSGVAELAAAAGRCCGLAAGDVAALRRAASVHDVGRVAVSVRIWQKPGLLDPGEWELVRLHPYHSERVLVRSPFLAALAPAASAHHERLDGSGYHRGATAAALDVPARLLAAADAFHAMTEPRPYREALPAADATRELTQEAREGRLDPAAVAAVIEAAGQEVPPIERPDGLTERESQVLALLARGLQTKQVARALGISVKTADRHVQNAYGKIGVSTRAAAALYAMEHGLIAWGEFPMAPASARP